MRLILASSSPRRRQILSEICPEFEIIRPHIDETQRPAEPPLDYVRRLSQEKALAVADRLQDASAAILAADTIVILSDDDSGQDEILGKPASADEARTTLQRLRDRAHRVCTAFTLLKGQASHTDVICTTVHMRDYSDEAIDRYIASGDPFDKAGSYAIQHDGFDPVARIEGSYSNVVGLPAEDVRRALQTFGLLNQSDKSDKSDETDETDETDKVTD
jgi:MAF protein